MVAVAWGRAAAVLEPGACGCCHHRLNDQLCCEPAKLSAVASSKLRSASVLSRRSTRSPHSPRNSPPGSVIVAIWDVNSWRLAFGRQSRICRVRCAGATHAQAGRRYSEVSGVVRCLLMSETGGASQNRNSCNSSNVMSCLQRVVFPSTIGKTRAKKWSAW